MNFIPSNIFDIGVVYKDSRSNKLLDLKLIELWDSKLIAVLAAPNQNNELNYIEASKASKRKPQSFEFRDTETRKILGK